MSVLHFDSATSVSAFEAALVGVSVIEPNSSPTTFDAGLIYSADSAYSPALPYSGTSGSNRWHFEGTALFQRFLNGIYDDATTYDSSALAYDFVA